MAYARPPNATNRSSCTAHHTLKDAGHQPEVIRCYGLAILPRFLNATRGRREAERRTGYRWVPTLVLDDGTILDGSREIAAWAKANPA